MQKTLSNSDFLSVIQTSFCNFIKSGTSRSTLKLKPLHGAIAYDISSRIGLKYSVFSQGIGDDREASISGRYMDKKVDITITKDGKAICGIGVKFVMQNYSQNSNNYFENMLGETANIRSNKIPYFQILILLDKLPYYNREGIITKWETISDHNIHKYIKLSNDNIDYFMHTPNKTLIYLVHVPNNVTNITTKAEYLQYHSKLINNTISLSSTKFTHFGDAVIFNDYELFSKKVYHTIMSL